MLQTFLPCPSASHLHGSDLVGLCEGGIYLMTQLWVVMFWKRCSLHTWRWMALSRWHRHVIHTQLLPQLSGAGSEVSVTARPWDSSGSCSTLHQQLHQLLVGPRAGAENSPWSVAQISTCRLKQLLAKTFHRPVAFIMSWHRDLSFPTYFLSCRALVVFSLSVYQIWFSLSEWGNWI